MKMQGRGGSSIGLMIFALILIILAALYFGGVLNLQMNQSPYTPQVSFVVSPNPITVVNNSLSSLVKATVIKLDSKNISTQFTISLKSSIPNVYPVNPSSDQKQYNFTTRILKPYNASDSFQFEVYANSSGYNNASAIMTIDLSYNGTVIKQQSLNIKIVNNSK